MAKGLIVPKRKKADLDQVTKNWLGMPPARAETRRLKYWFKRLQVSMYGDINDPGNVKARWENLLTRMESDFPQYKILEEGNAYESSGVYKSLWRHFQKMLSKWQKESP